MCIELKWKVLLLLLNSHSAQIESLAGEIGLQIAGYYAAPENFYESSLERAPGSKIADKIVENFSNACFVVVRFKLLI